MSFEHFLNCGLRQFAFFSYGEAWWIKSYRDAFSQIVKERGFDCHCYLPPASEPSVPTWRESQRPGLIKWLRALPRPIGVFTAGDIHSAFLLDLCRDVNVPVPEEIAILGMGDDSVICETVRPTLSSLDVDGRRIGYEAARLLDRMMAGKPSNVVCVPPSHVVVRQSTDLVAIEDADLAQVVRVIRESACTGINVTRVAESVGLSRRSLERRFRQFLGRTPKAEIMRVRIEHAKMLMVQTDQSTASIARKCGFSSLGHFTKAFRRIVGINVAGIPQDATKLKQFRRHSLGLV